MPVQESLGYSLCKQGERNPYQETLGAQRGQQNTEIKMKD